MRFEGLHRPPLGSVTELSHGEGVSSRDDGEDDENNDEDESNDEDGDEDEEYEEGEEEGDTLCEDADDNEEGEGYKEGEEESGGFSMAALLRDSDDGESEM